MRPCGWLTWFSDFQSVCRSWLNQQLWRATLFFQSGLFSSDFSAPLLSAIAIQLWRAALQFEFMAGKRAQLAVLPVHPF
jgi:hypothetical protein